MSKDEYDAMAEGSYWFCLNDLDYYVRQHGWDKVMSDFKDLQTNRKLVEDSSANKKQLLTDIPF